MTEKPAGDWFCPRCSLTSTENAESQKQRQGAKLLTVPKLGKTASTGSKGTSDRENKVMDKGRVRVKKGTAIKKTPPKKRPKWVGWAETISESEGKTRGA